MEFESCFELSLFCLISEKCKEDNNNDRLGPILISVQFPRDLSLSYLMI